MDSDQSQQNGVHGQPGVGDQMGQPGGQQMAHPGQQGGQIPFVQGQPFAPGQAQMLNVPIFGQQGVPFQPGQQAMGQAMGQVIGPPPGMLQGQPMAMGMQPMGQAMGQPMPQQWTAPPGQMAPAIMGQPPNLVGQAVPIVTTAALPMVNRFISSLPNPVAPVTFAFARVPSQPTYVNPPGNVPGFAFVQPMQTQCQSCGGTDHSFQNCPNILAMRQREYELARACEESKRQMEEMRMQMNSMIRADQLESIIDRALIARAQGEHIAQQPAGSEATRNLGEQVSLVRNIAIPTVVELAPPTQQQQGQRFVHGGPLPPQATAFAQHRQQATGVHVRPPPLASVQVQEPQPPSRERSNPSVNLEEPFANIAFGGSANSLPSQGSGEEVPGFVRCGSGWKSTTCDCFYTELPFYAQQESNTARGRGRGSKTYCHLHRGRTNWSQVRGGQRGLSQSQGAQAFQQGVQMQGATQFGQGTFKTSRGGRQFQASQGSVGGLQVSKGKRPHISPPQQAYPISPVRVPDEPNLDPEEVERRRKERDLRHAQAEQEKRERDQAKRLRTGETEIQETPRRQLRVPKVQPPETIVQKQRQRDPSPPPPPTGTQAIPVQEENQEDVDLRMTTATPQTPVTPETEVSAKSRADPTPMEQSGVDSNVQPGTSKTTTPRAPPLFAFCEIILNKTISLGCKPPNDDSDEITFPEYFICYVNWGTAIGVLVQSRDPQSGWPFAMQFGRFNEADEREEHGLEFGDIVQVKTARQKLDPKSHKELRFLDPKVDDLRTLVTETVQNNKTRRLLIPSMLAKEYVLKIKGDRPDSHARYPCVIASLSENTTRHGRQWEGVILRNHLPTHEYLFNPQIGVGISRTRQWPKMESSNGLLANVHYITLKAKEYAALGDFPIPKQFWQQLPAIPKDVNKTMVISPLQGYLTEFYRTQATQLKFSLENPLNFAIYLHAIFQLGSLSLMKTAFMRNQPKKRLHVLVSDVLNYENSTRVTLIYTDFSYNTKTIARKEFQKDRYILFYCNEARPELPPERHRLLFTARITEMVLDKNDLPGRLTVTLIRTGKEFEQNDAQIWQTCAIPEGASIFASPATEFNKRGMRELLEDIFAYGIIPAMCVERDIILRLLTGSSICARPTAEESVVRVHEKQFHAEEAHLITPAQYRAIELLREQKRKFLAQCDEHDKRDEFDAKEREKLQIFAEHAKLRFFEPHAHLKQWSLIMHKQRNNAEHLCRCKGSDNWHPDVRRMELYRELHYILKSIRMRILYQDRRRNIWHEDFIYREWAFLRDQIARLEAQKESTTMAEVQGIGPFAIVQLPPFNEEINKFAQNLRALETIETDSGEEKRIVEDDLAGLDPLSGQPAVPRNDPWKSFTISQAPPPENPNAARSNSQSPIIMEKASSDLQTEQFPVSILFPDSQMIRSFVSQSISEPPNERVLLEFYGALGKDGNTSIEMKQILARVHYDLIPIVVIEGPPACGKTTTLARIASELIAEGTESESMARNQQTLFRYMLRDQPLKPIPKLLCVCESNDALENFAVELAYQRSRLIMWKRYEFSKQDILFIQGSSARTVQEIKHASLKPNTSWLLPAHIDFLQDNIAEFGIPTEEIHNIGVLKAKAAKRCGLNEDESMQALQLVARYNKNLVAILATTSMVTKVRFILSNATHLLIDDASRFFHLDLVAITCRMPWLRQTICAGFLEGLKAQAPMILKGKDFSGVKRNFPIYQESILQYFNTQNVTFIMPHLRANFRADPILTNIVHSANAKLGVEGFDTRRDFRTSMQNRGFGTLGDIPLAKFLHPVLMLSDSITIQMGVSDMNPIIHNYHTTLGAILERLTFTGNALEFLILTTSTEEAVKLNDWINKSKLLDSISPKMRSFAIRSLSAEHIGAADVVIIMIGTPFKSNILDNDRAMVNAITRARQLVITLGNHRLLEARETDSFFMKFLRESNKEMPVIEMIAYREILRDMNQRRSIPLYHHESNILMKFNQKFPLYVPHALNDYAFNWSIPEFQPLVQAIRDEQAQRPI